MQKLVFLFIISCWLGFSQAQVTAVLKDSVKLKAETIFGADTFNTLYFSSANNAFNKKATDTIITYTNFQLGKIATANAFNPLKINLFYKDFNTVVVLDNRLAEISKIDFNSATHYKNVSFVSTGFDNTLWLFNQDTQQLELYDYKTKTTKLKTIPIATEVLDLKSNYNHCYLLTKSYLYVYNYFGSLVDKHKNIGYTKLALGKANVVLQKENSLHILQKNATSIEPIKHPKLLINQFLVTNQTLYLYQDNLLYTYQLKTN